MEAVESAPDGRSCSDCSIEGDKIKSSTTTGWANVKVGDNILSAQFIKELEHFYNKADVHDRSKCLQLITSMKHSDDLKKHAKKLQRPKTAMSTFATDYNALFNPYETSYTKDYSRKTGGQIWAVRPMTSVGYITSVPESQPLGPTVYNLEFCRKLQRPASPERAATSSGQRNNKPHPPQSFLVWKFPSKNRKSEIAENKELQDLTNEKLQQITKRLCHSVYQNDFLGIPQGFQVKSAFSLPSNWKDNVPYGKNSIHRESYVPPQQLEELAVATTRYGSNIHKQTPAIAAIPTANKRLVGMNGRTTYDSHFNDRAASVTEQIREAGRKREAEALRKIYGVKQGQDHIGKLLKEFQEPDLSLSRNIPTVVETQTTVHQHHVSSPFITGNRYSNSAACYSVQKANSARSYRLVPPSTTVMLPTKFPYQTPTPTPSVSVPFTPPLFLQ